MCIEAIMSLFKPQLPHPEEKPDYSRFIGSFNPDDIMDDWLLKWEVPQEHWAYWLDYKIVLSYQYNVPALIWTDKNEIWVRPEWCNPGVLAHEFAHESYSLLTETAKSMFEYRFNPALQNDKLLKFCYEQKPYMRTSITEAHADTYRYLGQKTPESLKGFYPKLF